MNVLILNKDKVIQNLEGKVLSLDRDVLVQSDLEMLRPSMFELSRFPLALRLISRLLEDTHPVEIQEITINNKNKGAGQYESSGFSIRVKPGNIIPLLSGPEQIDNYDVFNFISSKYMTFKGSNYQFLMESYNFTPELISDVISIETQEQAQEAINIDNSDMALTQFVEGDGYKFIVNYNLFKISLNNMDFALNPVDHALYCSLVGAYAEDFCNKPNLELRHNILYRYNMFLYSILYKYFTISVVNKLGEV